MTVGLSEAIRSLRAELLAATQGTEGSPVRFSVDSVDLQMQVTVERVAEAQGGVKFAVASAGAKGATQNSVIHTVNLHLTVESGDGSRYLAGSEGMPTVD
ncbi:MAG: hypothetical protein LBV78_25590 [Kitasatospora sp.]|jgi:hypothetical protein|nr:hypothetical protein [Kitasatospora sp.]